MRLRVVGLLVLGVLVCGGVGARTRAARAGRRAAAAPVVVFLGDSLTAGLGVAPEDAYPAVVGRLLAQRHRPVRVVNAGVSGDTTAGGRARLASLLTAKPRLLVVALGANDGLRDLPIADMEANLRAIVEAARAKGARVLLCGMRIPRQDGTERGRAFEAVFPRVAGDEHVPLLRFLLEGVAGHPDLNQPDGLHPTAAGHAIIARQVADAVQAVLNPPLPR